MKNNPLSVENLTGIFRVSSKDPSRIINREGTTIEFKESYNHGNMSQYFKAMASFANNQGGYILFGIGDKPRCLIGLNDKSLAQFEDLKVEEFTKLLLDYFSPEIKWTHCTFEFQEKCFGVIYVFPMLKKPCICKKNYDAQNAKYSLKEGDIYYRYGGRSERIKYTELASIIEEARRNEERQWLNFMKTAARIGVSNAALLDLKSGSLSGTNGSVVIDSRLLQTLAFIKEGKFVETGGTPTLRLIGDIKEIATGKVIFAETERKVVRAIEAKDIVQAFLENKPVDEPIEYIKRICSETSAYYPVYFFIHTAAMNVSEVLSVVKQTTTRSAAKNKLINRLEGKNIPQCTLPIPSTYAGAQKESYRHQWLTESISEPIENIAYCVDAILYLCTADIVKHVKYICEKLLEIYNKKFEKAPSGLATKIRKAICRVDEALYLES